MNIARVALLNDKERLQTKWKYGLNGYGLYIGEILAHAGIPFEPLDEPHHVLEKTYDVVLIGEASESAATVSVLWEYVRRGGILVSYAGLQSLAATLGCTQQAVVPCGYAELPASMESDHDHPLRFLHAVPWAVASGDRQPAICTESGSVRRDGPAGVRLGSLLHTFQVEQGVIERWAVDIAATVVGMQQGIGPVLEDGTPAPDGSANLNDGLLKADDQHGMDWRWDRLTTASGAPYFAYPYADWWRQTLIAHLLRIVSKKQKQLPFISYWPEGIGAVAMISHDSDRNEDEDAVTTMDVLAACGIHSTWCMMKPGYSAYLMRQIEDAGHELALHFNANPKEGGAWKQTDFVRQWGWLSEMIAQRKVISNKNHFTRFEGWGELFEWCEACGIESDQTRGPSKRGNVGFLFGTCHPYFPIARFDQHNRMYDVMEIGFLTQDIPLMTDDSVVIPFLETVRQVGGVAHFLFHQGRICSSEAVRQSLTRVVQEATQRGFVWMTGQQINEWQRNRRKLRVIGMDESGQALIAGAEPPERVQVWRPLMAEELPHPDDRVARHFGVACIPMNISYWRRSDVDFL